jgi:hypothetical protein
MGRPKRHPEDPENDRTGAPTRLYLVTHAVTGKKTLVDTYHPSRAVKAVADLEYRVRKAGTLEVIRLIQQGIDVITRA